MHPNTRFRVLAGIAVASLMSSAVLAQTPQPNAGPTATSITATTTTTTNWMTQEAAGQWRTSKMLGLNVYNNDNEKIGDIAELVMDKNGKLEAVVIGAGGFLGIGERDVAVPYDQIAWVFGPVAAPRTSTSSIPTTTGAATAPSRNSSYPDHAVLNMTKDQLKAAPAFKFSR